MARIASTVLVVALLAATAAAFALTQGLKLQKSPILGTKVTKVFSPVCACDSDTASIEFRLREDDRLDVSILDGDKVIRTIERGRSYSKGPVAIEWDGRDDAGEVLPEGDYQPRIRFRDGRQTITLPNPIEVDVTPPTLQDVSIRPPVISPDGDGRADRVVVRYRLSEDGRGMLFVNEKRRVLTLFPRTEETIVWAGKVNGRALRKGTYSLELGAFGRAGNRAQRTPPVRITIRYVSLSRERITVPAGERFTVRVSSDAERAHWTLGGRSGFASPGTLRLRAPVQPGRFTLSVSANGHTARAAVFVREPAS